MSTDNTDNQFYKNYSHTKLTEAEKNRYRHTRAEIYGEAAMARDVPHPTPKTERDYNYYSARREEASAAIEHYEDTLLRVAGVQRDENNPDRPAVDITTLRQQQHRRLVDPAPAAANETLLHAKYRNAFLDDHPYYYHTKRSRVRHEALGDRANDEAQHYRNTYEEHYNRASVLGPTTGRPIYPHYGTYDSIASPTPRRDPIIPRSPDRQAREPTVRFPYNGEYDDILSGAGRGYGSYGSGSSSRN